MKYLPFENFVLTTNLSVEEVRNRLANNIDAKINTLEPYEGSIVNNTFKIQRVITYRNSFLPVITGEISQARGMTEIKIEMRPVLFVLIFMGMWLGTVGIACIVILVATILTFPDIFQQGFSPASLIPFGMFIFGYLLVTLGFKYESSTSKEFLKTLFEAEYKE